MPAEVVNRFLQEREFWFPCGEYRMRYLHIPAVHPSSTALPAIVFVHGLLGYTFSWRHNLDFFAQHRDVYAIDLLGIGHSDHPEIGAADFTLSGAASRLLELLHSLGHSQFDLVATSHGGAVSMMAASQDRASANSVIRRLVLVAPAHPLMTNARIRLAFFRTPFGRLVLHGLAKYNTAFPAYLLRGLYGDPSLITPETQAGYWRNLEDKRSYSYALEVVRTWHPDMQQLRGKLATIADIPVLLLWGENDRAVPAESGLLLRELFRNSQYVVLPHVGHLPYEEAQDEFNRIVHSYLES